MYDAIIVGARIAGSTTALLLAQQGHSVLLIDRDRFPSSTLSTHVFFTDTLRVFDRIGIADQVENIDAPRLTQMRFPYVDAPFTEHAGRNYALCIRRETLDDVLVKAAEQHPSIEVQTETRVTDLLWDGDRVTGVTMRPRGSSEDTNETGRIVIGADGRNSFVAKAVSADSYNDVPPLFAWYYSYFRDVPVDDPPSVFASRTSLPEIEADFAAAFVFPTDDNLTLIGFGVQRDRFDEFRKDHERLFMEGAMSIPAVRERLEGREREGAVVGTGDLPNFLKTPVGNGWALVGDAGCHKDPHTIQGMGDAARTAELLADALSAWWRGDQSENDALASYHRDRDADLTPMYDFTTGRLEKQLDEEEWEAFGQLTFADPDVAQLRVAATAHAIPPAEVYSPEAIRRIVGATKPASGQ